MNEVFDYRIKVTEVNTLLQQVMNGLYAYGINVGMLNELNDMHQVFKDDLIPADIALLKALKDPLVRPLIDLIDLLEMYRFSIIRTNRFTDKGMRDAFHQGAGAKYWPVFVMFNDDDPINLPRSILVFLEETVFSLFSLASQLAESKLDITAEQTVWMESPLEALTTLKKDDINVCTIMLIIKDVHACFHTIYDIAKSVHGK